MRQKRMWLLALLVVVVFVLSAVIFLMSPAKDFGMICAYDDTIVYTHRVLCPTTWGGKPLKDWRVEIFEPAWESGSMRVMYFTRAGAEMYGGPEEHTRASMLLRHLGYHARWQLGLVDQN